jgi:hypothetical protein
MPEIKNNFTGGKMNKDLDERLMPKGQYRDAMNVEVSTSEGSSVGTLQNVLGNARVDVTDTFTGIPFGFKCVGSIADEKSNKLYWFVSSYEKDAILEHNPQTGETLPVIVDKNAWNSKAVLKFAGEIITGINIIDDLLLWTDNDSEPKKINIEECKEGTLNFDSHTQLEFERGSFNGMTLELFSQKGEADEHDFTLEKPKKGLYFWYEKKQLEKLLQQEIPYNEDEFGASIQPPLITNIRHYRNGEYIGLKEVTIWNNDSGMHVRLSDMGVDEDDPLQPNNGVATIVGQIPAEEDWHEGDIIFGNNITLDIEERHITIIKPKPLKAPAVKINHAQPSESTNNIPNLFETTFPRFSYRYKYRDGEFSTFAPFTEPVFNAKFPKDINSTSTGNVFYNKDNAYTTEEPYNKAMENSIHSIELTDFITEQTPEDVVEIDILYKQENSSVVYSVGTIRHVDSAWHASSNHEGLSYDLGIGETVNATLQNEPLGYAAEGSYNKGKYIVTTENIYAALPANQLLRPWDNVPRRALAQEVTGNRVVYGNYLQNYDIGLLKPEVQVAYSDRNSLIGSFTTQGLPSVKSQRNYQVGVVYCDKYGRETPVFTSDKGAINIPWQKSDGLKNASRNLQLNPSVVANFPEWVDSLKFFVKETSNPYYNLAMERAWVSKATYELDNEDGHLWISFPSSDRNKITEEDYIVLKKKIGVGEEQVDFENKFKVIDIKNEAPDAIKYRLVNYGTVSNTSSGSTASDTGDGLNTLFSVSATRPNKEIDTLTMNWSEWEQANKNTPLESGMGHDEDVFDPKDLYISWRKLGTGSGFGVSSKKYRITGGRKSTSGGSYVLKLSTPITKIDADIAHASGDSSDTSLTNLHADLVIQVERKELKDDENFSGSFFVKISKNQVTNFIEEGSDVNVEDNYIVSAKNKSWYWQDDIATVANINILSSAGYGLFNYNGWLGTVTGTNSIHHINNNNNVGDVAGDAANNDGKLGVTDYAAPWDGILVNHKPTFFIDAMHMVAGQSEASDYAKYCCVTWAGRTKAGKNTHSSWSYPPLKTWLTDFIDSENYIPDKEIEVPGVGVTGKFHTALKNGIIDISPLVVENDEYKFYDTDTEGQRITGWVGGEQSVKRFVSLDSNDIVDNHINGLEGIVTTTSDHSVGPRRWFSGITGNSTEQGVGVDTNTYANDDDDIDRHFMHLSFFAPGRNLVPDAFPNTFELFGDDSIGNNLQGIWGGGHFTGTTNKQVFGSDSDPTNEHRSLCLEGNNDLTNGAWLPETPGPGVGFGYDLDYRELHERQWDPTFNAQGDAENKIRDFIRNLHTGAQFKFSTDSNDEIYTIKKVVVKKLYNHTSWRKPYNRYDTANSIGYNGYNISRANQDDVYISVEEVALEWLNTLDVDGENGGSDEHTLLKSKIVDFGKASNRRLCYIIELDKNPTVGGHNPLDSAMSADKTNGDFADIEFVEQVQSVLLSELNKFPAIWEISPKKQQVDLDIYYEASNNIPVKLNDTTNELFAPIGCRVEVLDGPVAGSSYLKEWKDGTIAIFEPGFPLLAVEGSLEADYSGSSFKFIREDGGFTIAQAEEQVLSGDVNTVGYKTEFLFREDIGDNIRVGLTYYNCFSFNNGLESNRIKDDFNEMYIGNGVKASSTTQKTYEEERRSHGLIYSGLYNSNSGVNDLNQFIMAEKITKDLNPTYGSIQKLFQRRISLIAFCEDRVVSITSNKDALYNADGNPQLVSTNLVLGDVNPFVGDYGISTNPESFASESYRAYFTDKQRGAVLRLSKDGLTPISTAGMHDWFRDNLPNYTALIGTYDSYKQDYNISLSHAFGENIIYNTSFNLGQESTSELKTLLNFVANPDVNNGVDLLYGYERANVLEDNTSVLQPFAWGPQNRNLEVSVDVTMHAEIPTGSLQQHVPGRNPQAGNLATVLAGYDAQGNPITGTTAAGLTTLNGVLGSYSIQMQEAELSTPILVTNTQLNPLNSYGGTNPAGAPETGLTITGYTSVSATALTAPATTTTSSYSEEGYELQAAQDAFLAMSNIADFDSWDGNLDNNQGSAAWAWDDSVGTYPDGGEFLVLYLNGGVSTPPAGGTYGAALSYPNLFGPNRTLVPDNDDRYVEIKRYIITASSGLFGYVNENNPTNHSAIDAASSYTNQTLAGASDNGGAAVAKCAYLATYNTNGTKLTSNTITRSAGRYIYGYGGGAYSNAAGSGYGNILFDRARHGSFVEFKDVGKDPNSTLLNPTNHEGELMWDYNQAPSTPGNDHHNTFYNGDELHIAIEIALYTDFSNQTFQAENFGGTGARGRNSIKPSIKLMDGTSDISSAKLMGLDPYLSSANNQLTPYNTAWSDNNVFGSYGYHTSQANSMKYADDTTGTCDYGISNDKYEQFATVQYPSTRQSNFWASGTAEMMATSGLTATPIERKTIKLIARFKFKDPNTQDANGNRIGATYSNTTGWSDLPHEVKVIDDLRVRVYTQAPIVILGADPHEDVYGDGLCNNKYPLWEICSVKIVKGFGIHGPGGDITPAQAAVTQQAVTYTGPTLYENFTPYIAAGGWTPYEEAVSEIKQVRAVPPFPVPAWAEIHHQAFDWTISTAYGPLGTAGSHFSLQGTQGAGGYGPSFGGISQTGNGQNVDPALPPNVAITYTTPSNWNINSWNLDNTVSGAAGDSISTLGNPNYTYTSGNDENPVTITSGEQSVPSQYLLIRSDNSAQAGNSALDLEFDIQTDPWQQDAWYLVDLEFDDTWDDGSSFTSGLAGTAGDYGSCHVVQVGSQTWDGTTGVQIHPEGIGNYSGDATLSPKQVHVHLQQHYRTEYGNADGSGDGRRVIRAIFQAASDSIRFTAPIATQNDNQFKLRFFGFKNTAKLETVIVKRLDYGLTEGVIGGSAKSWEHTTDILTHSFAKRKIYWDNISGALCWSALADNNLQWFQRFGNSSYQVPSYPPPHPGEYGWILKFTVNPNPDTTSFVGKIRGYVNNNESNLGSGNDSYEGLYFSDIQDTGDYEIFFTTNGDEVTTPWYINHSTDAGATWVDYSGTANIQSTSSSGANLTNHPGLANLIMFIAGDVTGAPLNLEGAISNISLKDQTLIFQGGSAGSWSFDGWDNSIAPYIIWNSNAGVNGLIEFNDCPLFDPSSGLTLTTFLNANQFVNRNIDRFEKFEIEFNHGITEGMVKIYYFNSEGYGFRIPDIGPLTPSFYKTTVEIGDEIWDWENPAGANYATELKETFVIQVDDTYMLANPLEDVNGWIDNIRMTRVYDIIEDENGDSMFDEKTVTFSEDVNGWTSFKSFIPESGLSLSKKYFTIDKGGLWQHYVPLKEYFPADGSASYLVSSSVKNAENYNMFYGVHSTQGSSVRVILNNEPSTVKTFNTLNYEGTQAQILKPSANRITPNNAAAWSLSSNIQGWYCEDVKTNLDIGNVKEFIEKEGKWFNYIRGKNTLNEFTNNVELDTSRFSVQGIGESSNITTL